MSTNVPRPVINGRVVLWVGTDYSANPTPPVWYASGDLDTNGVCTFESLPPGRVEVTGYCDGFVSSNGPVIPGRTPDFSRGQPLSLEKDQQFDLEMMPAASCEVLVLDAERNPLPGAKVSFLPNVIGGGGIFGRSLRNSEETIKGRTTQRPLTEFSQFEAETGADGTALVEGLPGFGQKVYFWVEHAGYTMPAIDGSGWRHGTVMLNSGETSSVTTRMEKKGDKEVEYVP